MPKNLPLYFKYENEYYPQAAFLEIDLGEKTWAWAINQNIGSGIPMSVWHRRVLWIGIDPYVTKDQLERLTNSPKFQHHIRQILENSTVEWNGRNHVGNLNREAEFHLDALENMLASIYPEGEVWSPEDWLSPGLRYNPKEGIYYVEGIPLVKENLEKLFEEFPEEWGNYYIPGLHDYLRELVESPPPPPELGEERGDIGGRDKGGV